MPRREGSSGSLQSLPLRLSAWDRIEIGGPYARRRAVVAALVILGVQVMPLTRGTAEGSG